MVAPARRYHVALVDPLPAGLEASPFEICFDDARGQTANIADLLASTEGLFHTTSAEEVLLQKSADAAQAAQVVKEQGEEAQRAQPRATPSMWEKAGKAAFGAAAASAGTMMARKMTGRRSGGSPVASAASAAAGTLGSALGGPMLGRFARGLLGALLR